MATSSVTYGTGTSTAVGTTYLDGLVSGLNTTDIIDQLAAVQGKAVDRLKTHRSVLEQKLAAFTAVGAAMGSLQLTAQSLASSAQFLPFQTAVSNNSVVAAAANDKATAGSHTITISQLAEAHKISSGAVADASSALGYEGDIRINGETIGVKATWTLSDLRSAIDKADCGVTASVLRVSATDSRLILTSKTTGLQNAIDLVDANGAGILSDLGLVSEALTVKHAVTDGVQSDGLTTQSTPVAAALDLTTPPAGTITINGHGVDIDLATDSLLDIADKINATPEIGATASVVSSKVDGKTVFSLQIVGDGGTPALEDNGTGVLTTLGILGKSVANEMTAAADAAFTIDGFAMTRSSNSVDDAITGVSIELTGTTSSTVTLTVSRDADAAVKQVQALVEAYNSLIDRIGSYQAYDAENNTGGLLSGNQTLNNLVSELRRTLTDPITTTDGSTLLLRSLGVTADGYDKLSVNTGVLTAALKDDPDLVSRLFGFSWSASTSEISYVSSTNNTADSGLSGFSVNITQVATKSAAASAALAAGIAVDETLTFEGAGSVTLTAGMTLDEAANALNAHFGDRSLALLATVDGDTLKVEHEQYGSRYGFSVTSSLDQGVGGTDLGGATAGEARNWANGRDVAGTINGEACSGRGQFLTGNTTNSTTAGLTLRVSAQTTGEVGRITLAEGAAKRLSDYIGFSLDSGYGSITRAKDGIEGEIDAKDDEIKKTQERIQVYIDKMRIKFTTMETLLGKAQNLQSYLTGQLESLPRNYMPTK